MIEFDNGKSKVLRDVIFDCPKCSVNRASATSGKFFDVQQWMGAILKPLIVILGLTMNLINSPDATGADHLEIVREVLLDAGAVIQPHAIAQTRDGGYVVAGQGSHVPWALRTDAGGNKMLWRYIMDMPQWKAGGDEATYQGVAILPDDSALLCGWKNDKEHNAVNGLLTHIDKAGKVISEKFLKPDPPIDRALNYLVTCQAWGDGVAVIGKADRLVHDEINNDEVHLESILWLLALDAKADIKWQKLIPGISNPSQALVMPDEDLIIVSGGGGKVARIDPSGTVKAQGEFFGYLVRPAQPESAIYNFYPGEGSKLMALHKFNDQLEEAGQVTGGAKTIHPYSMYRMADGSLLQFGYQPGSVARAAISWVLPSWGVAIFFPCQSAAERMPAS